MANHGVNLHLMKQLINQLLCSLLREFSSNSIWLEPYQSALLLEFEAIKSAQLIVQFEHLCPCEINHLIIDTLVINVQNSVEEQDADVKFI